MPSANQKANRSKIKNISFVFSYLVLFALLFFYPLRFTPTANAQIPPPYIECPATDKPEWNSLRPYQASPCNVPIKNDEQALLCGKDFIVRDTFTVTVPRGDCPCEPCSSCPGQTICHCRILRDFDISLNAYDSELPIAGNTELIPGGKTSPVAVNEKRLTDWVSHLPPDPIGLTFQEYYKEYQNWRGRTCPTIKIPLINKEIMFCFDNPLSPNYWSNLFPYIPYSSTEDRIGKTWQSDMINIQPTNFTVEDLVTAWKGKLQNDPRNKNTKNQEGVLYFPHMEENVELTNLLQSTFLAKDNLNNDKAQQIKSQDVENPQIGPKCTILDVRSNPGDQLFGEQLSTKDKKDTGAPAAHVSYIAVFDCPADCICTSYDSFGRCMNCTVRGQCTKSGTFYSSVETWTPMADELWSKTVSGNSSVFRKIFPKIGEGGSPVDKLKDIPTVSSVEYIPTGDGISLITQNPELYFPHFGGIYDYFLKDIQSALRPKDYPGVPAGLSPNQPISEPDRVNEYVSWYLNGTLFRAEGDPLSNKDPVDIQRLIDYSGPLNKLLPQAVQWRVKLLQNPTTDVRVSRVGEVERATINRHDQIAACTLGVPIPFSDKELLGYPIACSEKELASVGQVPSSGASPSPGPGGTCPSVPDSGIDSKYLTLKSNFIRMANNNGGCHMAETCFNYVVSESKKAGVNPALTLTLWLHESNASDYCGNPGVEDFGVHTIPGEDIVGQLAGWLEIGKASMACSWCYNQGEWSEPMQAFLYNYKNGGCNSGGDQGFYNNMKDIFQWVNDPVAYCLDPGGTGFKINCPNDMSCP